ncbi:helix-turn-helix domain-containing protein [Flavobacterium sp.]|uniref:helix-turn-helix domain-containing protein n=1 Tax=Flavobacterium sp. TaxID=239 RepID=UPI0031CE3981
MNTQIFLNGITIQELADAIAPLLQGNSILQESDPSEFITREEACKILSINKTSLWKHTKSGKLKSYGIGNRVLYKRSEIIDAVKPLS